MRSFQVPQSRAEQTYRARFTLQVRFNPANKQQLAYLGIDQKLHILDAGTGAETLHLAGADTDKFQAFGFTADGKQIAAIVSADTLKIWDTTTGKLTTTITSGIVSEMEYFALSPNGKYIATDDYGDYAAINLWDVVHAQLMLRLPVTGRVIAVAFSPDSRLLVAALGDGSLAIWDVAQLTKRATLQMGVYAFSVAFSPDRTRLLAAGDDGTVWVWGVPNPGYNSRS
jgi:WD40 repeat protein